MVSFDQAAENRIKEVENLSDIHQAKDQVRDNCATVSLQKDSARKLYLGPETSSGLFTRANNFPRRLHFIAAIAFRRALS